MTTNNISALITDVLAQQVEVANRERRSILHEKRATSARELDMLRTQVELQSKADDVNLEMSSKKAKKNLEWGWAPMIGGIVTSAHTIGLNESLGRRANDLSHEAGLKGVEAKRIGSLAAELGQDAEQRRATTDRAFDQAGNFLQSLQRLA